MLVSLIRSDPPQSVWRIFERYASRKLRNTKHTKDTHEDHEALEGREGRKGREGHEGKEGHGGHDDHEGLIFVNLAIFVVFVCGRRPINVRHPGVNSRGPRPGTVTLGRMRR